MCVNAPQWLAVAAGAAGAVALLQQPDPADAERLKAMGWLLIWLFVLVVVFLVGSLAIFRMSRRFRESLERRPPGPTPTDDVWAMHRLPEGAVEAVPEDPRRDPALEDTDAADGGRGGNGHGRRDQPGDPRGRDPAADGDPDDAGGGGDDATD